MINQYYIAIDNPRPCANKLCVLDLILLRKLKDESVRNKPVYLNPFTFAFPITAIVSFLHRVSGAILFFLIPVILSVLASTLYYQFSFSSFGFNSCVGKIFTWVLLSALIYHLLSGVRHLIMDIGYTENKSCARITAIFVLCIAVFISLLIGYRLC